MSPQKMERIRLFHEMYPSEKLFNLDTEVYSGLREMFIDKILGWEGKGRGRGECSALLRLVA
jgi:hypothetical protein